MTVYTGGARRYQSEELPKGDAGVDRTVERMTTIAQDSARDHRFITFAQSISLRGGRKDSLEVLAALVKWVRDHWTFRRDPVHVELVKTPERLLTELKSRDMMIGDCDDASVLIASLTTALGYPSRFVVLQRKKSAKSYDHIYVETFADGRWHSLDGVALGREPFYESNGLRRKEYPVI